jgi:hypothetical protein
VARKPALKRSKLSGTEVAGSLSMTPVWLFPNLAHIARLEADLNKSGTWPVERHCPQTVQKSPCHRVGGRRGQLGPRS